MFVFHHPQELAAKLEAGLTVEVPTFDSAQEEIAKSTGLMADAEGQSKGTCIIITIDKIRVFEPHHEKTNVPVSDQVRHKPGCIATEVG